MNSLTCPNPECRTKFANVKIENGKVMCPECDELVFEYLAPDENIGDYSPASFMKLLDTRGVTAAKTAARFFKPNALGKGAALYLVGYVWTELAKTVFVKDA